MWTVLTLPLPPSKPHAYLVPYCFSPLRAYVGYVKRTESVCETDHLDDGVKHARKRAENPFAQIVPWNGKNLPLKSLALIEDTPFGRVSPYLLPSRAIALYGARSALAQDFAGASVQHDGKLMVRLVKTRVITVFARTEEVAGWR